MEGLHQRGLREQFAVHRVPDEERAVHPRHVALEEVAHLAVPAGARFHPLPVHLPVRPHPPEVEALRELHPEPPKRERRVHLLAVRACPRPVQFMERLRDLGRRGERALEEVQRARHGGFTRRHDAGGSVEPLAEDVARLLLPLLVVVDVPQVGERRKDRPVTVLGLAPAVEHVAPREEVSILDGQRASVAQRQLGEVRVVLQRLAGERTAHRDETRVREVPEQAEEAAHPRAIRVLEEVRLVRDDQVGLDLLQEFARLRHRQLRVGDDEEVLGDLKVLRQLLHLATQRDLHRRRDEEDRTLGAHNFRYKQRKSSLTRSNGQWCDETSLLFRPIQSKVLHGLEGHGAVRRLQLRREVEVASGLAALQQLGVVPLAERGDASRLGHDVLCSLRALGDRRHRRHRCGRRSSLRARRHRRHASRDGENPRHGANLRRLDPLESGKGVVHVCS